jgi:hypothetical protein
MESTRQNAPWGVDPAVAVTAFYHWDIPGNPVRVALHLNVIDRLERVILQTDLAGGTAAGLLLGRSEEADGYSVTIESFVPIVLEQAHGEQQRTPIYNVPAFTDAINRWRPENGKRTYAVGMYCTTRNRKFLLSEDDLAFMQTHFPRPDNVTLLVRPSEGKPSTAVMLTRTGGKMDKSAPAKAEFPFNRGELLTHARVSERPLPIPSQPNATPESPSQQLLPEGRVTLSAADVKSPNPPRPVGPQFSPLQSTNLSDGWVRKRLIPGTLIVAGLLAIGLAAMYFRDLAPAIWENHASSSAGPFGLKAVRQGTYFEFTWNPEAPTIRNASRGRFGIIDGYSGREMDLNTANLQSGRLVYMPQSENFSFRLEAYAAKDGKVTSESIRVQGGIPVSPSAEQR